MDYGMPLTMSMAGHDDIVFNDDANPATCLRLTSFKGVDMATIRASSGNIPQGHGSYHFPPLFSGRTVTIAGLARHPDPKQRRLQLRELKEFLEAAVILEGETGTPPISLAWTPFDEDDYALGNLSVYAEAVEDDVTGRDPHPWIFALFTDDWQLTITPAGP